MALRNIFPSKPISPERGEKRSKGEEEKLRSTNQVERERSTDSAPKTIGPGSDSVEHCDGGDGDGWSNEDDVPFDVVAA